MRLFLISFLALFLCGCSKGNKDFTGHCASLSQDVLPPGDPARIYIASAFTPNGDGINDYFRPQLNSIVSLEMKIYDKAGNNIYQTTVAEWLPLFAPKGAELYYYRIEALTASGKRVGQCGEVYALECLPRGRGLGSYTFEDQLTPSGFTGVTAEVISNCP